MATSQQLANEQTGWRFLLRIGAEITLKSKHKTKQSENGPDKDPDASQAAGNANNNEGSTSSDSVRNYASMPVGHTAMNNEEKSVASNPSESYTVENTELDETHEKSDSTEYAIVIVDPGKSEKGHELFFSEYECEKEKNFGSVSVGCLGVTKDERYYVLTVCHAISPETVLLPIQVLTKYGVREEICFGIFGATSMNGEDYQVDIAAVSLRIPLEHRISDLNEVYRGTNSTLLGRTVWKYGAGSRYTRGRIVLVDYCIVTSSSKNSGSYFAVEPDESFPDFAVEGDSGSLVWSTGGVPIGIVSMGGKKVDVNGVMISATLCCRLDACLHALKLQWNVDICQLIAYDMQEFIKQKDHHPENIEPIYYDEQELKNAHADFIERVNKGKVTIPSFVQGVQLHSRRNIIYVYIDKSEEEHGKQFVKREFPLCKNVKIAPINPFRFFYTCGFCGKKECPSKIGNDNNDVVPKEWIGAGSPIFAIATEFWNEIRDNSAVCSLDDVIRSCKAKREKLNEIQGAEAYPIQDKFKPLWALWTVGYHNVSANTQHVLTTIVHSLVSLGYEKSITFLSEVKTDGKNEVIVIGRCSKGALAKHTHNLIDILQIQVNNAVDPNLLKNKVKSCCNKNYYDVELDFSKTQKRILHTEVTKRGIKTGNTYGKIVVEKDLHIPTRTGKEPFLTEAIAVNTPHPPFAIEGDSGSLVLESSPNPRTPKAFGLVSGGMEVYLEDDEVETEPEDCAICVKIEQSLKDLEYCWNIGRTEARQKGITLVETNEQ